jgi:phenylpropionate dioxygenase-like ring-hydroxylating dioxygenase large terminal subunit
MGTVCSTELACRYHGLRCGPDGRCLKIPARPDLTPSTRFTLTTFPVVERYGFVWTCLKPDGGVRRPPMPAWADPAFQPTLPPFVDIAGSAGRQVERFVDVAHFALVHPEACAATTGATSATSPRRCGAWNQRGSDGCDVSRSTRHSRRN